MEVIKKNQNIFDIIKKDFTNIDKKIFDFSYNIYKQYGENEDFCIDLEDVYKWIGYSDERNLKHKILIKNFIENIDYKICSENLELNSSVGVSFQKERNSNSGNSSGGRPKNYVYLKYDCFVELCQLANTEIAKNTRRYLSKIDKIFKRLYKKYLEESLLQDKDNQKLLEEKEKIIEVQKKELEKKDKKKELEKKDKKKHFFYLYNRRNCDSTLSDLTEIGITNSLSTRSGTHSVSDPYFKMDFYYHFKDPENSKLLERILKFNILKNFKLMDKDIEWFSIEYMIYLINKIKT